MSSSVLHVSKPPVIQAFSVSLSINSSSSSVCIDTVSTSTSSLASSSSSSTSIGVVPPSALCTFAITSISISALVSVLFASLALSLCSGSLLEAICAWFSCWPVCMAFCLKNSGRDKKPCASRSLFAFLCHQMVLSDLLCNAHVHFLGPSAAEVCLCAF